ncbi:hypothetical protein CGBL_0119410 [Corynebacterium glutamicum]|nr:hypothetical protein CGBL_0119410 [Corynebacterium glutamicum]
MPIVVEIDKFWHVYPVIGASNQTGVPKSPKSRKFWHPCLVFPFGRPEMTPPKSYPSFLRDKCGINPTKPTPRNKETPNQSLKVTGQGSVKY